MLRNSRDTIPIRPTINQVLCPEDTLRIGVYGAMSALGTNGILCLMGVSTGQKPLEVDASCLNMQMVLGNKTVFGTVSSNRSHFERSIESLACIEKKWPGWLSRLITRRLTLDKFRDGLDPDPDNIKTVIDLT